MRGKDLLECMEYIDDALIQEALEAPANVLYRNKTKRFGKWGVAAACIAMIGISVSAFWLHQDAQEEYSGNAGADTASPIAMDATVANDSGGEGSTTENMPAENNMASDTQTDMVAGGQGTAGSDAMADNTDTKQSTEEASASFKDYAATTGELQDQSRDIVETETERLSYTVVRDYYGEKDNSVYDYPVPGKGDYFCSHYLQETIAYYTAQENALDTADSPVYAYEVVIDLYGDVEKDDDRGIHYEQLNMLDTGSVKIEQEYRRLAELGYAVKLSEDFQLTGTFTKIEFDTFQASPEYGYIFRFANEY